MIINGLGDAGAVAAPAPVKFGGITVPYVPPLARMVMPGIVVGLVDRKKHPIVWWVLGAVPLGLAGAAFVAEHSHK